MCHGSALRTPFVTIMLPFAYYTTRVICVKIVFGRKGNGFRKVMILTAFISCFALFTALTMSILMRFKPVFAEKASHAATISATNILNTAISTIISGMDSQNFVNISTDENGAVTSISADTIAMNKLKTMISAGIADLTEKERETFIYIPVGSLTDYPVLQGMGYRIPVRISIDGISSVDFDDEFVNSGINQVKHKIYLSATANISVISSAMTTSEAVTIEIPVAETVIVGDVPTYYGDNLSVVGR